MAEAAPRVGVFGSAFNPPHLGHVLVVSEARWELGLDRMVVVPTGDPYHKASDGDPGREARLEMARLAFADEPDCEVVALEMEREGPTYTVDTLEQLASAEPTAELVLVLGADAALGFREWKEPDRILELADLAIAPRSGIEPNEVERTLGAPLERVRFFEMPRVDVTATLIRERIESGTPFGHLVPQRVSALITERGYYR